MGNKDYQSPEKRAERALKNLADKCSRKEYCCADIRKKLEQWELQEEEAAKVMQFLQEYHFVDDRRYARSYAEDKARFNRWGRQKIALMLRQKGIAPDLITEALEAIPAESYAGNCLDLLQQKARSIAESDPYKRRAKLIRFALGRGFDYETVQKCLTQLGEEE